MVGQGNVHRVGGDSAESGLPEWRLFELLCASAIVANALLVGWMAQHHMKHGPDRLPQWAILAERGCVVFFTLEVVLKLCVYGVSFFCCKQWKGNLYDFLLVVAGLTEVFISNGRVQNLFHLMRMLRLIRIVRFLRRFREFRLLTTSIVGSGNSLFWSFVLLAGVTYLFGVVLVEACAQFLDVAVPLKTSASDEEVVRLHWGSVHRAMLSLFMAATGGQDWGDVADTLLKVGSPGRLPGAVYGLFLLYVGFFLFSVTNAITAVFVESMMRRAAQDNALAISDEMESRDNHVAKLRELFHGVDSDQDGVISYNDFVASLHDPDLHAFASSLGIDTYDMATFFKTLAGDLGGTICEEAFVTGCIKLRGEAKAVDMYSFFDQHRGLCAELKAQLCSMELKLNEALGAEIASPATSIAMPTNQELTI